MKSQRFTIAVLTAVVAIAGMNQGLTLPLLAILLEQQGVSTIANGLNTAALYIGMLLVSPWLEWPLRRFGFRSTIFLGLVLLSATTLLLPLVDGLTVWFCLRLLMGVGDNTLHYASQIWVTQLASPERRGRILSVYGLAYGVGFSVGPLGINLLPWGTWAPFAAMSVCYLAAFVLLGRIGNAYPPAVSAAAKGQNRYAAVVRMGWLALIPSFLYGFMEASLNGSFPVYALRVGVSAEWVSVILPSFVIGSLVLQLPLGSLSDRIGRQKVMVACAAVGALCFALFPLAGSSVWSMVALLTVAGAAVGSFYSLGLAFAADILPGEMVPTAGIIAGMNFSVASIVAPNLNGCLLPLSPGMMFYVMAGLLGVFVLAGLSSSPGVSRRADRQAVAPRADGA